MWLPDWLYKYLPFIYAVAGLFSIYYANNLVGIGAGALLIFAGFLVWNFRKRGPVPTLYRRQE
jgi:hypothetical protein